MRLKKLILRNSLYFFFSVLSGCGLFTFSNVSLSADVHTFSIQFYTEVSDGPTDMLENLTEALGDKIARVTTLTKVEKDGDIQYEGIIQSFSYLTTFNTKSEQDNSPKEIQRLTITIEVSYLNPSDEASSFKKKQFSASEDMMSTDNKLEKEAELVEAIFRKIVDDICIKTIDIW